MNKLLSVAGRPISATSMLWKHRRTVKYLLDQKRYQNLKNFIFTTYFIRGEDCGKGVLDPIFKLFPQTIPFIWDIEVEVTTRCYLRCRHCEHTYFPKEYQGQDLTIAEFKNLIDSLPNLKWINLTGEGSPFLNKDFMAMLRYVKSKGIFVDFSHDFFMFNEDIGRELINLGIERIYFSIDGATPEVYNNVRVGSDFDRVIKNVKRFIQLKKEMQSPLPELCFRFAFFKDNYQDLINLPALIASLGDRRDMGDDASVNIVGLLEFEQTKGLEVELPQNIIDQVNKGFKDLGITVYWSHPTHNETNKPPMDWCVFHSEPYVMITGHVIADCAVLMSNRRPFLEAHSFGNIKTENIKQIWDSDKYREFRRVVVDRNSPVPSICYGCRVFNTFDRAYRNGIWDLKTDSWPSLLDWTKNNED